MRLLKRASALMLGAVLAIAMFSGCSASISKDDYASTVVATWGDENVYLSEANFYIRRIQYYYESLYFQMGYDSTMWDSQVSSTSKATMADNVRESAMVQIFQTMVLNSKAEELGVSLSDEEISAVKAKADTYMESVSDLLWEEMNITADELYELFEKNALANKVWEAVVADVDTEVSDEEAQQKGITYVLVPESAADYDPETVQADILERVQAGEDLSTVASEYSLTASTDAVGEEEYADTYGPAAWALSEGESNVVFVEGKGWYIIHLDSEFDETATETEKTTIITNRKSELFTETYEGWLKDLPEFVVDSKVLDAIDFGTTMYIAETTTATTAAETTSGADAAQESSADGETAAADETAASDESTASGESTTVDEAAASADATTDSAEETTTASE